MPVPTLDFGVFIAYLLPGVIVLYGVTFVAPQIRDLLQPDAGRLGIGGAVLVTILALTAGRLISIARVVLIESTFTTPLPLLSCTQRPYLGGIPALSPDYRQLFESGRREAFILAIANEQRPMQFCGNTALAVIVSLVCWLISLTKQTFRRPRMLVIAVIAVLFTIILYVGARSSYYEYMRAMAAINGVQFASVDHFGKPCQAPASLR
jgi:hypothetical protein